MKGRPMTMEKRGDVNPAYTPGAVSPSGGGVKDDVQVAPDTTDRLKVALEKKGDCACGGHCYPPRPRTGSK